MDHFIYKIVDGIERLERYRRLDDVKGGTMGLFRVPRWNKLISPVGGILLLDSKQIIRAVFLRLQHAILVTVLKRYAV